MTAAGTRHTDGVHKHARQTLTLVQIQLNSSKKPNLHLFPTVPVPTKLKWARSSLETGLGGVIPSAPGFLASPTGGLLLWKPLLLLSLSFLQGAKLCENLEVPSPQSGRPFGSGFIAWGGVLQFKVSGVVSQCS